MAPQTFVLGLDDLAAFQRNAAQDNLLLNMAPALNSARFDTRTWSPQAQFGTNFLQAFLSTALGEIGRNQVANDTSAISALLPSLYKDPGSVTKPEGMSDNAFETIKNTAILRQFERQNTIDQLAQELLGKERLLEKELSLRAETMKQEKIIGALLSGNARERAAALEMLGASKKPESKPGFDTDGAVLPSFAAPNTAEQIVQKPTGRFGSGQTLGDKMRERFQTYVNDGAPGSAAADMATAELKADRILNESAAKRVEEARQRAAALKEMTQKASFGVENAGETGGALGGLREGASKLFALVSSDEQRQRDAQKVLDSIAPDVIKATRSPGALTEREMETLLKSGPSSKNTPSENRALIAMMEQVGRLEQDYADFLDAYVAERGDTRGADVLWSKYKQANPLYFQGPNQKLILNTDRTPWTDFDFVGAASGQSKPRSSSETNIQDRYNALRKQGKSPEQAKAELGI